MITERIKDLYKTSNGKYIAPQKIETALCEDRYIDMGMSSLGRILMVWYTERGRNIRIIGSRKATRK